jgi:tripeptide aminopeptidase
VVTDYVEITGESRSHDAAFVPRITAAFREAFTSAASRVKDDQGRTADVKFESRQDYFPFRLSENEPVVKHALAAAQRAGLQATVRTTNGGLDANWLVKNGVPTITFGAGQRQVHTVEEYVELTDYLNGCRLALALATAEG